MSQTRPKVSVIIPVYKAELYIEKCVRSLFGQTLDSLQYIFVDDCSPDRSIAIMKRVLEEFPERKDQVVIIRHDKNKGVGQTRQDGIDRAEGEYLIHCDPDDWVDLNMYEILYNRANETDADIVMCDFMNEFDTHSEYVAQSAPDSKKTLFHYISVGKIHCSLWNKLIAASIAKGLKIEPGVNLWEDLSIVSYAMILSKKIEGVERALYHYNIVNSESVTHGHRYRNSESKILAIESLSSNLKKSGLIDSIDINDLYYLQINVKRGLLSYPSKENLDLWNAKFPDANRHYKSLGLSVKMKIFTFLALHRQLLVIKLYERLIYD